MLHPVMIINVVFGLQCQEVIFVSIVILMIICTSTIYHKAVFMGNKSELIWYRFSVVKINYTVISMHAHYWLLYCFLSFIII